MPTHLVRALASEWNGGFTVAEPEYRLDIAGGNYDVCTSVERRTTAKPVVVQAEEQPNLLAGFAHICVVMELLAAAWEEEKAKALAAMEPRV